MGLFGTIAPTDFGWYDFLSRSSVWPEVNFWTPSTHFSFRADEFSPFFFKLKAPYNAICGFGYFANYSPLPDWLAWSCFEEGNGCASLKEMRDRISAIRLRMRYVATERAPEIGCIVIVNATLFARHDNGLLLRADLHRLFEQGYLTVTTEHRLRVSERLRVDFNNGKTYYPFRDTSISLPRDDRHRPDPDLLRWHNDSVFLG